MPIQEFGFESNYGNHMAKDFKGTAGSNYRLSFVAWPGMEKADFGIADLTGDPENEHQLTARLWGSPRAYVPGVGMVLETPENSAELTKHAGKPPAMYVATIVASWSLKKGNVQKPELEEEPTVMPWVMSSEKFAQIKNLHRGGFPMWKYDLSALCSDAKFQKFTFAPVQLNLFRELLAKDKEIAHSITQQVRSMLPQMPGRIGRDMTVQEIRVKLGTAGAFVQGNPATSDKEVDNLLLTMLDD